MEQKNSSDIQYDLISSPMMINRIVQKMLIPNIGTDTTKRHYCNSSSSSNSLNSRRSYADTRGLSRTATTILDKSLPVQEIQKYGDVIRLRNSTPPSQFRTHRSAPSSNLGALSEAEILSPLERFSRVSVYSGPLHNDRMVDESEAQGGASVADRLAAARMMQKSGYTWDQAGSCAKIRLGDGAILQNLYPSHSHVKLRNGKIERIDAYYQRMLESKEVLTEVATIKNYEYNQWSRTRPLNPKDYESAKPVSLDKMESKCTQPSWYTMRPNNSLTSLGAKNRLFSYEDLVSKFSQPKFLKRLGFIDDEADYKPIVFTLGDDEADNVSETNENISGETEMHHSSDVEQLIPAVDIAESELSPTETEDGVEDVSGSEELSSDDEEYHNESHALVNVPPERVPSSKRSNRQRLAVYRDDNVISRRITDDTSANMKPSLGQTPTTSLTPTRVVDVRENEKYKIPLPTVKLVDSLTNMRNKVDNLTSEIKHSKSKSLQTKALRKESSKLDFPLKLHYADRKCVKFSQPICLCPKLSKETLNSLHAPSTNRYYVKQNYGLNRCQLHSTTKYSQPRDKVVLKSL